MAVGTAIAAAVGIAGTVYSSSQSAKAGKKAAKKAGKLFGPYIAAGSMAIGKLARGEFGEPTPAYAFRLKEATRALNRRLARLGKTESGQAIREDIGMVGRLTSEEVEREESRLFGIAGMGLQAAGGGAQAQYARGGAESSFWGDMGGLAEGLPGAYEGFREAGRDDPSSWFYQKPKKSRFQLPEPRKY